MSWIVENKRNWRKVVLILLVLAIIGPWSFDLLSVPAEYDCEPPNIRMKGDYCGAPVSMISGFFNLILGFFRGEIVFTQTDSNFWILLIYDLVFIFLLFPLVNSFILILRGDRPRLQKFHLVVCGLNLIPVLFVGLTRFRITFFAPWGVWLYFGVLISILVLEGFLLEKGAPPSFSVSRSDIDLFPAS